MRSSPSVMSSRPTIIRSRVDFPQPEGPTRMTNSPSSISRLTSLTAGNPSPYFLTRFCTLIAAICESTLHRTGRQPGDDLALEEEDEYDDRDRHDHRGRGDHAGRFLELRGTGERRQRRRHGA